MPIMEFRSDQGRQRYDAFVAAGARAVIGLDFDGTLVPIVDDPKLARIHPRSRAALLPLSRLFPTIAVITGRPVAQVLELGDLAVLGQEIAAAGGELLIFGQYGHERWSSRTRQLHTPAPPEGLADLVAELPRILEQVSDPAVWVEDKGLAVALHTRRCADPDATYQRLLPLVDAAASAHGLDLEPGRRVIEVRQAQTDKGMVVLELARERAVSGFCFIGDDLGDLAAFTAVTSLAESGLPTLLVASESSEEPALLDLADAVVPGPDGVAELLEELPRAAAVLR